jgi:hypothetical protein
LTGEGLPRVSVDVLGGGRFVYLDSGLTIENLVDVDRSKDWLDPFIGARLKVDLIDRLSVSVRGDIGGFGVGSHFTWNMAAILAYQMSQRTSVAAGYRMLDIDYSDGKGANKFQYDVQMPALVSTFFTPVRTEADLIGRRAKPRPHDLSAWCIREPPIRI